MSNRYSPVKALRRGREPSVSEGFGVLVAVLDMVRSSDALELEARSGVAGAPVVAGSRRRDGVGCVLTTRQRGC